MTLSGFFFGRYCFDRLYLLTEITGLPRHGNLSRWPLTSTESMNMSWTPISMACMRWFYDASRCIPKGYIMNRLSSQQEKTQRNWYAVSTRRRFIKSKKTVSLYDRFMSPPVKMEKQGKIDTWDIKNYFETLGNSFCEKLVPEGWSVPMYLLFWAVFENLLWSPVTHSENW